MGASNLGVAEQVSSQSNTCEATPRRLEQVDAQHLFVARTGLAQHPFVARVEGFVKFDFSDRGVIVLVTNFSKADGPLAH